MLFNSHLFLAFFVGVYALYWLARRSTVAQNALLLIASYVFYATWDWRFCSLLAISTLADFTIGRLLDRTESRGSRKGLVGLSIAVNLGVLGFFKYFDFFTDSAVLFLQLFGITPGFVTLQILLPVGISFYTFQTLSYTIDVYRRRIDPGNQLLDFALFVSFFPQLVAGPIERASHFLPQIARAREFRPEQIHAGLFLILWGFFKKLVVADNLARIANEVFNHHESYVGMDLVLGTLAFTFQIYCDFSAYSDIARGLAKLLGFDLMVNFKLPYFSRSPSEFWQRWHISLSSWLRDYLYIPLGGNRGGDGRTQRNLLLTMLLGGLWHGAAWHFVLWGLYHGLILVAYRAWDRVRKPARSEPGLLRNGLSMALMFGFTLLGWVIFRCENIDQIWWFLTQVGAGISIETSQFAADLLFFSTPLIAMQIWQQRSGNLLAPLTLRPGLQVLMASWLVIWIGVFGARESVEFIYFQF